MQRGAKHMRKHNQKPAETCTHPKPGFNPGRRNFLKAVAFGSGALGIGSIAVGCAPFASIRNAFKRARDKRELAALLPRVLVQPDELPDLKDDCRLLRKNYHRLTPREAVVLEGLYEELLSLSEFLRPKPPSSADGLDGLHPLVFPVWEANSHGSGTLITPRHALTAEHLVSNSETFAPCIQISRHPETESGPYAWADVTTRRPWMDLALLTLPQGSFPFDGRMALAKLHPDGPAYGSRVHALGYPHRERRLHGYDTSLLSVDCTANVHLLETSTLILNPIGEQLLPGKKSVFCEYNPKKFPDQHGISGGPIASADGRIMGVCTSSNKIELVGVPPERLFLAAGTRAIRALVVDYLIEKVAAPIMEAAAAMRQKLSSSAQS